MKAIKVTFILILVMFFCSCQEDDRPVLQEEFVRFSLMLDNNGNPLVFPQQSNNALEVFSYTLDKRDTLKLPVVLSTSKNIENLNLDYSVSIDGLETENLLLLPNNNQLNFNNSKFSDTIVIVPQQRFNSITEASIEIELNQISDEDIHLGYPRVQNNLSIFTVFVENTQPIIYQFEDVDYTIEGNQDEEFIFSILFDQLTSFEEISEFDFFDSEFINFVCDANPVSEFDFSVELIPFEGLSNSVKVRFTILEDVGDFESNLNLNLRQVNSEEFIRQGNSTINFTKDANLDETRVGDPAANWYDTNNNFHRTFGRAWYFDEVDGECDWQSYQAFTRPVEVETGSEFDNGEGYHRFRIGFRSIIANPNGDIVGTNPFNFRRYYDGASVFSPAYAINEALEFYPNPNQTNEGIVRVIPRTLQFFVNDETISVPMCGSGNYAFNDSLNAWEMFVTLICDETEINGNPLVEKQIFVYSLNVSGDPENLDEICSPYYEF